MMELFYLLRRCDAVMMTLTMVFVLIAIITAQSNPSSRSKQQQIKSFPYLYAQIDNYNASYPIMEYIAMNDRQVHDNSDIDDDTNVGSDIVDRPNFLYTDTGTYRIVEFYVHWCDLCKNFKSHYIQFGKRVHELASVVSSSANTSDTFHIEIYAISCAPNRPLCRALEIDQYPLFRLYRPGDTVNEGIDISHTQLNPTTIFQLMGIVADGAEIDTSTWDTTIQSMSTSKSWLNWGMFIWENYMLKQKETLSTTSINRKFQIPRSRNELRDDIHLSFDYAMRHGIFISDHPLSEDRASVLEDWLHLLHKTIPISYTTLRAVIKDIIDHFDYVKRSETYLVSILDEYPPPTSNVWSMSCSYGIPDTGYTCGLWLLFHTITVGVVDYNNNVVFARHRLATESVARIIRQYVQHFFACEVCRHNFLTTFDLCKHNRCKLLHNHISDNETDWIQLPLWLFETHNAVNVRLLNEKAIRENAIITINDELDVTWPLQRDCPKCWQQPDRIRNDTMMYKYLKVVYGQHDTISSQYNEELLQDIHEYNHIMESHTKISDSNIFHHCSKAIIQLTTSSIAWVRFHSGMIATLDDHKEDIHQYLIYTMIYNLDVENHVDNDIQALKLKHMALLDMLRLLRKTLPASWYDMHSLIQELFNNWTYISKSKDYLYAILSEYPPSSSVQLTLSSIVKSNEHDKYNMDHMLDLLHVVSIGALHYNKFIGWNDNNERLSAVNVATIIRNYIDHCLNSQNTSFAILEAMNVVCRNNNNCSKLSKNPGYESDWIHLPIYMFQVHNEIAMTRHEQQKMPSKPNSKNTYNQWPSTISCPKCLISDKNQWDIDMVYKYLLLLYSPSESRLMIGLQEELFGPTLWDMLMMILNRSRDAYFYVLGTIFNEFIVTISSSFN